MAERLILITGATGYIAGRLIPRLLDLGYRVRCLARNPHRLRTQAWFRYVDVVAGDIMIPSTLPSALEGVHTAYYLIHNMASGPGYTARENESAQNFLRAAEEAGLQHIVYLGGLADEDTPSGHMRSRLQTGKTLRQGRIPVTEFRASVIVGPGSISFEMIRYMTELMPVIFAPRWLQNLAQPIAIQNVIDYLVAALEAPTKKRGNVYEIGGPDVFSYAEAMLTYGRLRGLRRRYVVMPFVPLWFMALGVEWMTPVPAVIARPLVDGMRGDSVVRQSQARQAFPHIRLLSYEEAVREALTYLHPNRITPGWEQNVRPSAVAKHEGFLLDHRQLPVSASPEQVFTVVCSMGGQNGWPYANSLWRLRGWLDRLLGGRGRSRPSHPRVEPSAAKEVGDLLDFYRIEALEANRRLLLHAELKAPGEGWMEWKIQPHEEGSLLSQTGFFAPRGLPGFLYWYGLWPLHSLVFRGLIRAIARQSEQKQATAGAARDS